MVGSWVHRRVGLEYEAVICEGEFQKWLDQLMYSAVAGGTKTHVVVRYMRIEA